MGAANCNACEGEQLDPNLIDSQVRLTSSLTFPKMNSHFPDASIAKPAIRAPTLSEIVQKSVKQECINPYQYNGLVGIFLPPFEIQQFGMVYEGEWLNGAPHGRGKAYLQGGAYFEGEFKEGVADCVDGLFVYSDGSYYRGAVTGSKANGHGRLVYLDKVMLFEGQWIDNKPHGHGIQKYKDGSCYEGAFKNGLKHGRGKFSWVDGGLYEGTFFDGSIHGEGIFTRGRGLKYKGTFVRNKKDGYGEEESPQGLYVGLFRDGKRTGKGELRYKDGRRFQGLFADGKPHGQGVLIMPNGQMIEGEWREGENVSIHEVSKSTLKRMNMLEDSQRV